ncbi:7tm 6 domain containing protein, partial [Asbolus verrucosus]
MNTLNNHSFQPKSRRQRLLIKPALNLWKMMYNTFTVAGAPLIALLVFRPLLDKTKEFQFPINVRYPFNTKIFPLYEIAFLHQIISVTYVVIFIYNADMLIVALLVFIETQCDILCDDLQNLQDDKTINFNKKLIASITHHKEISKNLDAEFFAHLVLVIFYMLQIFAYCWFGNEVEAKSNQIPYSVFKSNWTHHSLSTRKNMMMLVMRSQKPIRLSTFNLFYLSLDIYIK